jgi:hypothetical protein
MKNTKETSVTIRQVPPPYYHVTSRESARAILADGLKAGADGHVYLLSTCDLRALAAAASGQCGHSEFVVLEVCASGIRSKPKNDNVAEMFSAYQWRVKQTLIAAGHVSEVCRIKLNRWYNPTATMIGTSNPRFREAVAQQKKRSS